MQMKMREICMERWTIAVIMMVVGMFVGGTCEGSSGLHSEQSAPPARVQTCREGCLQKFATEDFACLQGAECSMCWDQCAAEPLKINTSILDTWKINIVSMVRQGSLVSADVAWPIQEAPSQCLVTWEVAGGGLMGNLLTDSNTVELSLWPETKYRVEVTCKTKETEVMTRSIPLTIDTSDAIIIIHPSDVSTSTSSIDDTLHLLDHNNLHYLQSDTSPSQSDVIFRKMNMRRYQMMFGFCAAIFIFGVVLATLVTINLRRRRLSTTIVDKETLIDNEYSPDFQSQTVHV